MRSVAHTAPRQLCEAAERSHRRKMDIGGPGPVHYPELGRASETEGPAVCPGDSTRGLRRCSRKSTAPSQDGTGERNVGPCGTNVLCAHALTSTPAAPRSGLLPTGHLPEDWQHPKANTAPPVTLFHGLTSKLSPRCTWPPLTLGPRAWHPAQRPQVCVKGPVGDTGETDHTC